MANLVPLSAFTQFAAINLTGDGGYDKQDHTIPNCAQITLIWAPASGILTHNVLHGRYAGGFAGTVAQANSIRTALTGSAAWTTLATFLATTTQLAFVTIRDVNSEDQPIFSSDNGGAPGSSASPELPDEVSLVITKRTALIGRENRGRIYVPGWATNSLGSGNTVAAAAVTALQTWANTISGALAAQGYTFVIGHRHRLAYTTPHGTPVEERPKGSVPITSLVVRDNHWDSQRRRGLK